MSVGAHIQALHADCKPTEKLVLIALADHVGVDMVCIPSVSRVQKLTGLSRSGVRSAMSRLEESGFVKKEHRKRGNGSDTSNEYRLFLPSISIVDGEILPLLGGQEKTRGGAGENPQGGQEKTPHNQSVRTSQSNLPTSLQEKNKQKASDEHSAKPRHSDGQGDAIISQPPSAVAGNTQGDCSAPADQSNEDSRSGADAGAPGAGDRSNKIAGVQSAAEHFKCGSCGASHPVRTWVRDEGLRFCQASCMTSYKAAENIAGITGGEVPALPAPPADPLQMDLSPLEGTPTQNETVDPSETFNVARVAFPGRKRGNPTEFANYQKKHKDWRQMLPTLLPAINREKAYHDQCAAAGTFCAPWKNLSTWINQRCFEEEFPEVKKDVVTGPDLGMYGGAQ